MKLTQYNRDLLKLATSKYDKSICYISNGKLYSVVYNGYETDGRLTVIIPQDEPDGLYDSSLLVKTGNSPVKKIDNNTSVMCNTAQLVLKKELKNTVSAIPVDLSVLPLLDFLSFVTTDVTRDVLKCVHVNNQHIVATSGYSLLMTEHKQECDLGNGLLLPPIAVKILNKIAKNERFSCLTYKKTHSYSAENIVSHNVLLLITTDSGVVVEIALPTGQYPNYIEAIPKDNSERHNKTVLNRNEFLQTLATAKKEHAQSRTKTYNIIKHNNGKIVAVTKAESNAGELWQGIEIPECFSAIPNHCSAFNIDFMYNCMKNLPLPEVSAMIPTFGGAISFRARGTTALIMPVNTLLHDDARAEQLAAAIRTSSLYGVKAGAMSCNITPIRAISTPKISSTAKVNSEIDSLKDTIKQLTNELRAANQQIELLKAELATKNSSVTTVPIPTKLTTPATITAATTVDELEPEQPIKKGSVRMATFNQVGLIRRITKGTVDYATIKQLTYEQASTAIGIAKQANGDKVIGSQSAAITTEAIREAKDFINKVLTIN